MIDDTLPSHHQTLDAPQAAVIDEAISATPSEVLSEVSAVDPIQSPENSSQTLIESAITEDPLPGSDQQLNATAADDVSRPASETALEEQQQSHTSDVNAPAEESFSTSHSNVFESDHQTQRKSRWPIVVAVLFILVVVTTAVSFGGWYWWSRRSALARAQQTATVKPAPAIPSVPEGMVYVKGGTFQMGRDDGDEYERPAHEVTINPFYIDKYEVTCEQYQKFVDATHHSTTPNWKEGRLPIGSEKLPVTGVTWDDANAYAEWAGKRLPTEEEWEFAARGSDGRRYSWGNEWRTNATNSGASSANRLSEVGSYPDGKTPSGAMDMIGNAWEWTASDLVEYPGGRLPYQPAKDVKVIRGGSWKEDKNQATTTYRGFLAARGAKDYSATGFRCAKGVTGLTQSSINR